MKESRIDYAAQAQELAFRAWWLDTHDKGPVPPRPRRWDSSNIWRFSGPYRKRPTGRPLFP